MSELVFNVHPDVDGGYWAREAHRAIHAQGDTWEELCQSVLGGVDAWFAVSEEEKPKKVRLYLHREQELLVA